MRGLLGTTSYLSFLCNRGRHHPPSPCCVNYASTSQQLITSSSARPPEDHEFSSVYLHLKRQRALTSSKTSQSQKIVITTQWVYNFYWVSHRCRGKGWGPHFAESGTDFFFLFFWTQALTKTLSGVVVVGRRWLRSKASKFLASGPNQPRGPRRGGETSASFLNWSHWDPQGSPRRTRRKAIKIWPCGSDKELGGKKAEKKKDGFWGKKQREQRGRTVGGEEPVEADQGETWETRRVGLFSRVRLGKTVCQWGDRTGEGLVLSAIKPMLHVRWCAQPIQQACIFILPGSWQLTGWIISCWPEIRPWTRLVCLSTACWGPPRKKHYQSIPETPQPARHTAHLARPLQERTSTQWGYVCVISQLFTAQYKAIIEGIIKGAKIIQNVGEETKLFTSI